MQNTYEVDKINIYCVDEEITELVKKEKVIQLEFKLRVWIWGLSALPEGVFLTVVDAVVCYPDPTYASEVKPPIQWSVQVGV